MARFARHTTIKPSIRHKPQAKPQEGGLGEPGFPHKVEFFFINYMQQLSTQIEIPNTKKENPRWHAQNKPPENQRLVKAQE